MTLLSGIQIGKRILSRGPIYRLLTSSPTPSVVDLTERRALVEVSGDQSFKLLQVFWGKATSSSHEYKFASVTTVHKAICSGYIVIIYFVFAGFDNERYGSSGRGTLYLHAHTKC
eukprot:sb/3476784/